MPANLLASELNTQYWEPCATGPVFQVDLSASSITPAPPSTINGGSNYTSNVIVADGFKAVCAAVTSTQVGNISIQRYVDRAGTIAQGVPTGTATAAIVASTPVVVNVNDGLPFQSFKIIITNTSGSTATITNFALLLSAS